MKKSSIVIVALVVVISAFVIGIVAHVATSTKLCTTKQCVIAAANLINAMDTREDPCENFYDFACGNFVKTAEALNTSTVKNVWTLLSRHEFDKFFTEKMREDDPMELRNLKHFYRSCSDRDSAENKSMDYMKEVLSEFGGWPIINSDWQSGNFDWVETTIKLRQRGLQCGSIVEWDFDQEAGTTNTILTLSHASKYIPEGEENKTKVVRNIANVAEAFGENPKFTLATAREIFDFAIEMNNIYLKNKNLTKPDSENATYLTIGEVQSMHPQVDWLTYINAMVYPTNLTEEDKINFRMNATVGDLLELLRKTPKRVIANLMLYEVISNFNAWLPDKVRGNLSEADESREFLLRQTREDYCTSAVMSTNIFVADLLYVEKYTTDKMFEATRAVFEEFKERYREVLKSKFTWMDEETKKFALKKLEAMGLTVGSRTLKDRIRLQDLPHSQIDYTKEENYIKANALATYNSMNFHTRRLTSTPEEFAQLDMLSSGRQVNAYYRQDNEIMMTPAMLQHILYEDDAPKFLQYALLGYILGHEMSHGFHSKFKWSGEKGDMVEWWSNETQSNFAEETKCLVDNYEEYTEAEFKSRANGTEALDENLCDMAGLYVAYELFQKHQNSKLKLPGLENYTTNQLFWIHNAYFHCESKEDEDPKNNRDTAHGVSSFRASFPLAQLGYFAKDFECPLGSNMNPKEKCLVY